MIYYSITENLTPSNQTEPFQLQRFGRFKQHRWVTSQYMNWFSLAHHQYDLSTNEFINMYTYYQQVDNYHGTAPTHQTLSFNPGVIRNSKNNYYEVLEGSQLLAKIFPFNGRYGSVSYVEYYDSLARHTKTVMYDIRGFISRCRYFGSHHQILMDQYLNANGDVVIEKQWDFDGERENEVSLIKLMTGVQPIYFTDEISFFSHFLAHELPEFQHSTAFVDEYGLLKTVSQAHPGQLYVNGNSDSARKMIVNSDDLVTGSYNIDDPNQYHQFLDTFED